MITLYAGVDSANRYRPWLALFGYPHVACEAGVEMAVAPGVTRWIDGVCSSKKFMPFSILGAFGTQEAA